MLQHKRIEQRKLKPDDAIHIAVDHTFTDQPGSIRRKPVAAQAKKLPDNRYFPSLFPS